MTNGEKDLLIGYPVDAGELGPDGDAETQFLDWRQVIAERRVNLGQVSVGVDSTKGLASLAVERLPPRGATS